MGLRALLSAARRRRWFVLVTVAAGFLAGVQATSGGQWYTAQSSIYVGSRLVDVGEAAEEGAGTFALTSSALIGSRPIVDEMLTRSGIDREPEEVLAATTAELVPFTQLLRIHVRDHDPILAKRMANGLADVYLGKLRQLEPARAVDEAEGRLPPSPAYVFERADLPTEPDHRDRLLRITLGTLVGLGATIVAVLLAAALDPAPRTPDEVQEAVGIDVLGAIPRYPAQAIGYGPGARA